jgi:outer membrane receptor protein involved in Fe transport
MFKMRVAGPESGEPPAKAKIETAEGDRFIGLIYIDGVRSSRAEMGLLKPDQIESVEVIKGERATSLYSDPAAAKGVIKITTRRAGSGK